MSRVLVSLSWSLLFPFQSHHKCHHLVEVPALLLQPRDRLHALPRGKLPLLYDEKVEAVSFSIFSFLLTTHHQLTCISNLCTNTANDVLHNDAAYAWVRRGVKKVAEQSCWAWQTCCDIFWTLCCGFLCFLLLCLPFGSFLQLFLGSRVEEEKHLFLLLYVHICMSHCSM